MGLSVTRWLKCWLRAGSFVGFVVLEIVLCATLYAALSPINGAAAGSAPTLATGNTYVVNSTADAPDADVGTPNCAAADGKCTLRAAIMQANFATGPQTVTLLAGVYVLTRTGDEDAAILGDLDIAGDLTIQGAGPNVTI